jgi:hypothetical protein
MYLTLIASLAIAENNIELLHMSPNKNGVDLIKEKTVDSSQK